GAFALLRTSRAFGFAWHTHHGPSTRPIQGPSGGGTCTSRMSDGRTALRSGPPRESGRTRNTGGGPAPMRDATASGPESRPVPLPGRRARAPRHTDGGPDTPTEAE